MPRVSKTAVGRTTSNEYMSNGVTVSPAVPTAGESIKVVYDGLLSKSGATDVLAHVGYGNTWDNLFDYRMTRTSMGFETTVPVSSGVDTMNVCFKDCANNWDNNSGKNYTFDIS